VKKFKNPTLNN